ncbi:45815_t:CDS:2, partial [Gigaspora margarita]
IKGELTVQDAEHQNLRDKVIRIEEQYNKYRELTPQVTELEAENTVLKKEKAEWMSYSDYLDQEKNSFNGNLPYEFYKVLVARRVENNILQEKMNDLERQVIRGDSFISENESKIKQLNNNYESMKTEYTSELEVSKRVKTLLKEEVELLMEILKSYEEKQQYCSNRLRIDRVQVIEYLLRRYKKELEQAQSNHNQKFEDQYNCSNVNPNTIKILQCIEELQELMSENSQLLEKLKQLQKTTMNNHIENNDEVIANVIPAQSFMNLENENKQLIEKIIEQNQRISKILKIKEIFEIAIQKYEVDVNNLGYRIEVSGDNEKFS